MAETPAQRAHGVAIRSLTPGDAWVPALVLTHPSTTTILRLARDVVDRTVGGETYYATPIQAKLADEIEGQGPTAEISVAHIGQVLASWMEHVDGGVGGTAVYQEIGANGEIGYERTLDIVSGVLTQEGAIWALGYDVSMDRALVQVRYDPVSAPGLFGLATQVEMGA